MSEGVGRICSGAPVGEKPQSTGQSTAVGSQLVGEPQRTFGVGAGKQDPFAFQPLEALREDVGGNSREAGLEVVEAARTHEQRLDHKQTPAIAYAIQGGLERRDSSFLRHAFHVSGTVRGQGLPILAAGCNLQSASYSGIRTVEALGQTARVDHGEHKWAHLKNSRRQ